MHPRVFDPSFKLKTKGVKFEPVASVEGNLLKNN